ncbi:MAG: HAMP domain-containing histidine kinase, partial [Candidatus Eremiobacteraeota bacterium]|nr:HAMP domain-containing histidine kinase [Candidatus Eremiobacteraeota bacterium]
HELRTPLTAIGGYHQLLEKGGYAEPAIRERAFATLRKETRRMRSLVERLVGLARLERGDAASRAEDVELDVAAVVRDAVASVLDARPGQVNLRRADRLTVKGDEMALHIAVSNLVENALKYGRGSEVDVDVLKEGDEAVVRVADGGPGIPEPDRGRIFERFYRGDHGGTIEGSGLGLSIAKRAAERNGGRVVLERADPGDTAFSVRIPVAPAPAPL